MFHSSLLDPMCTCLAIFNLGKMTGYAATRFGWAFVKDEALAKKMEVYLWANGQGTGIEVGRS